MANVYVDNAENRKLGRVGMPRGSMPVSADGTSSPAKTYVDNYFNRRHGRVDLPHGSMVVTKENDSVNRLRRKYNDGGSPDSCYSSIRSSTNLHLKVIVQIILASYSHSSHTSYILKHHVSCWYSSLHHHLIRPQALVARTYHPPFSNFLFTNLFSIKFLYFLIISSLFPYFNLFVSIFIQSYVNIKLHVTTIYRY